MAHANREVLAMSAAEYTSGQYVVSQPPPLSWLLRMVEGRGSILRTPPAIECHFGVSASR